MTMTLWQWGKVITLLGDAAVAVSVELRCRAVAVGRTYLLSASFVWRCLSGSTMTPFPHPAHRLTGFRLVVADHALGLPVFRALSLCTCCRHYPGAASGRTVSLTSPSRISLPRKGRRVGLRIVLFEMLWGIRQERYILGAGHELKERCHGKSERSQPVSRGV